MKIYPAISILGACILFFAPAAMAQTIYTWNGGSGDWEDSTRWTPSGVPASADTAVINSGTSTLTADTEIAGFELHGSGILAGDADFIVTESMVFSAGGTGVTPIQGTGTVTVASGATLLLTGSGNRQLSSGRTLVNAGTATWEMTGDFRGSGQVVNEGEMLISFDAPEPKRLCFQSNPAGITNAPTGLIRRTGTGEAQFACIFNNHGTVRVEQGALVLQGFHPMSGNDSGQYEVWADAVLVFGGGTRTMSEMSSITGGGTVEIRGGTTTLAGIYDLPTTRMSDSLNHGRLDFDGSATMATLLHERGDVGGTGIITVTDSYTWLAGNLSGSGKLVVAPGATLTVTGTATKRMEHSWTLQHEGTGELAAAIHSNFGGGTIRNDGTLTLVDDAVRINSNKVVNAGILTKTGSGEVTVAGSQSFTNTGTINVVEGTMVIRGAAPDMPDTGTYSLAEGTTLILGTPGRTLASGAVIEGTGTFHYENRTVTNHATLRPGLSPGILTFDGNYPAAEIDGVLEIELAGYEAGIDYNRFAATGTMNLGGVLQVALAGDFEPAGGDRFTIIEGASVIGEFAVVNLPEGFEASLEVTESGVDLVFLTSVAGEPDNLFFPAVYALAQAYPNPFNPSTVIQYDVPAAAHISIEVIDAVGRRVALLIDHEQPAGSHSVSFEAGSLPSGVYFYRITSGDFQQVRQMILLR